MAFTLIELLVVIAVIAILVAILVPSVAAIKKTAKRHQSVATAKALVQAFSSYHYDYDRWPGQPANSSSTNEYYAIWTNSNSSAIDWLLPDHPENSRQKDYWARHENVMDAFGATYTIVVISNEVKVTSPNISN